MNISRNVCCWLLAAIVGLEAGCARQTAPVQAQYYPVCHEPLAYLQLRSNGMGSAVAAGAVQAGVLSGIASAIIGAVAGGINGTGVAVSVGVGSVLGGTVGAINRGSARQREDNKHLAAYLEQIDGDIEGLDIVSAAATASRQCYHREFQQLLVGIKNKTITPEAARSRFNEIETGERESTQLLRQPSDDARLRTEFDRALDAAEQDESIR